MPPGTVHMVLTVKDSISTGAMFYNPWTYHRTLETMIRIHAYGMRMTNTSYPGAQAQLFKLVAYYYVKMKEEGLLGE
jgi:hypothetical protein